MSRSQKTLAGLVILLGLALVWAVRRPWAEPPPPEVLRISTGTEGGTYFTAGKRLARLLEEYSGAEIGKVEAKKSLGTLQNCRQLASSEVDLAFGIGPVLANTEDPCTEHVAALMALYSDRVQVVVQKSIQSPAQLKDKLLYIGADLSGTKEIAKSILPALGISDTDYRRADKSVRSFQDASSKLSTGELDAAFFMAATPAKAVLDALDSGCCNLLDLRDHVERIERAVPGLTRRPIPASSYPSELGSKLTVGANALLIGRKDLPDEVVAEVLNTLFDHIADLAVATIRVQDVRLETAFDEKSLSGVGLHRGVHKFQNQEAQRLLIATGALNGKYYDLGKRMQLLLDHEGIPARVIHTDGSLENLRLLWAKKRPTVAVIQYDTALASIWSPEIYGDSELAKTLDIPRVQGLRRIATLHDEKVHILIRRKFLEELAESGTITVEEQQHPTLDLLKYARVCLGPKESGARVIAQAVLRHHGIPEAKEEISLSVHDMVERIHNEELDAGFFVSHVPSEVIKTLVDDPSIRLLPVDTGEITGLLGAALRLSEIKEEYRAQHQGEPVIDTVATRAVLVAREDLPFDVETITRAVFEGAAFLGISQTIEDMARELPSLPLHPGAEAYYKAEDIVPSPRVDWLTVAWRSLAILVFLFTGYRGFTAWRRERTAAKISKRILHVPLGSDYDHSVEDLLRIRREARDRAQRQSWQRGELDEARSRTLVELIGEKIEVAKLNLQSSLLRELRSFRTSEPDPTTRLPNLADLEKRIWVHLENGELNASQHQLILEFIREDGQGVAPRAP
jgi:TRAP transporter TAXI family solute receptor